MAAWVDGVHQQAAIVVFLSVPRDDGVLADDDHTIG